MSKAVKAVGRAVSKVVKGVTNAVKKVASSKLGRVILTAAAIYFGGAAIAGGLKGAAAGTGFLSGMGTGIANAASGLSTAWSSALSGNFAKAGSALSSGFQGQAATSGLSTAMGGAGGLSAGAGTTAGVTQGAVGSTMGGAGGLSMPAAATGSVGSQLAAVNTGIGAGAAGGAAGAAGAASAGSLAQGMIGAAKISAGTQLVGGLIQGAGQQRALEDQRNYEQQLAEQQRSRYSASVDEFLAQAKAGANNNMQPITPGAGPVWGYDPVADARAISERQRAEFESRLPSTGLVARGMQFTQPTTNNNFPIYNPMYFRG